MKAFLLALCATFLLTACPSNPRLQPGSPAVQTAKIAVQYGVLRYLGDRPIDRREQSAERIRNIVTEVVALAGNESASIGFLKAELLQRLPADLEPEERLAIASLIDIVMAMLQEKVGQGLLKPDQILAVQTVGTWVIEATEFV
jgi:beta-lactamase class A